jgi:hypothetical protein
MDQKYEIGQRLIVESVVIWPGSCIQIKAGDIVIYNGDTPIRGMIWVTTERNGQRMIINRNRVTFTPA